MRQKRKEELLCQFPILPDKFYEDMQGKGAANYCVFLTEGKELFVRCYHRYSRGGKLIERQRYVFAKDGYVRYIYDEYTGWRTASRFREPVFCQGTYGYTFDNSYCILGFDAVEKSDMKYSQLSIGEHLPISYLALYCRHKNLEYIVKAGYGGIITENCTGYWGRTEYLQISEDIDWKSNNLLKMLHLNKTEFKLLQGQEGIYSQYIYVRSAFPKYKPEENIAIAKIFGYQMGTIQWYEKCTGLKARRLARYMYDNNIPLHDYNDYLRQCEKLEYDMHDTAISMPHDFYTVHERLSATIEQKSNEITQRHFKENYEGRKAFEFESGDLFLRQPNSLDEIVAEGKALCHCVGGYCERHAKGSTNIFFIRKKADPDTPYYTIEVGTDYDIIQCRGYRNDRAAPKGEEIKAFEKEYTKYLEELKHERENRVKLKSA